MTRPPVNGKYDLKQELKFFSTLLREAARSAGVMIRACWNLIISTQPKNTDQSQDSLVPVTAGPPTSYDKKFASAEFYAQTAIENIQSDNKITTQNPESLEHCRKSLNNTELASEDFKKLRQQFRDGTLDLTRVSVAEWLNLSFLTMFNAEQIHLEQPVLFKGSMYSMHACVSSVVPPEKTTNLRKKQ